MATTLIIKDNDKEYTLGFTRRSIEAMEERGFDFTKANEREFGATLALIKGAFQTHQPKMKEEEIFAVWGKLKGKEDLYKLLIKMFQEPLAVLSDPEEEVGNVSWTVSEV